MVVFYGRGLAKHQSSRLWSVIEIAHNSWTTWYIWITFCRCCENVWPNPIAYMYVHVKYCKNMFKLNKTLIFDSQTISVIWLAFWYLHLLHNHWAEYEHPWSWNECLISSYGQAAWTNYNICFFQYSLAIWTVMPTRHTLFEWGY